MITSKTHRRGATGVVIGGQVTMIRSLEGWPNLSRWELRPAPQLPGLGSMAFNLLLFFVSPQVDTAQPYHATTIVCSTV